jgi:selenium metabolism protein YedF
MALLYIDARGQQCPKPLIMTKKALKESNKDDSLSISIDNETSNTNVMQFLKDNGIAATSSFANGVYTIITGSCPDTLIKPDAESYCTPSNKGITPVIVFKSDKMGTGDDELGEILIKAFVNTIKEINPLPSALIFYNIGVLLSSEGSPVLDSLKDLENKGVNIISCGTCLDYYNLKNSLRVGSISNMYTIMETLSKAQTIIYP